MALDPSIIFMGKTPDFQKSLGESIDFGQGLRKLVVGRKIGQMNQLATPQEKQAFIQKNNLFGRELFQTLKDQEAAAAKAANDQLKFDADLNKTYAETYKLGSESGKIGAETGKINTETGITRQNNVATMWNVYLKGGAGAAKAVLEGMKARGLIDETNYQAELTALTDLDGKTAAEQQQYALGRYKGVQDAKYSLTTADNVLDNQTLVDNNVRDNNTSAANNVRTTQASIYGTDKKFQSDQQDLDFRKSQVPVIYNEQQQALKNGTAKLVTINGVTYVDYGNGKGEPYINAKGEQVTPPPKPTETKAQKLERQEKVIGYRDAAQTAAETAQLAAQLVSDSSNLNMSASRMALESKIPGQPAHTFAQRIETLKSQVFLNQVKQMQGMGALTDAEGARLEKSIASLDIYQDPVELQNNLTSIAQTMAKAAKSARDRLRIYKDDGQQQTQVQMPSANAGRPSASYMP